MGGLPCAYVFMALMADIYDHLEWKNGFRVDGAAMSIYSIITVTMTGVCTGIFNLLLSKAGYVAPSLVDGVTVAAQQPDSVKNMLVFCFVGLEVITAVIVIVLLSFVNVEKGLKEKQDEIAARREAKKSE